MGKRIMMGLLLAVVVLGGAWWLWVRSARGFSANAKPTWIEARVAALSRWLALPGGQSEIKNPFPATAERLAAARQLYHTQCAACHGDSGDGQVALGQAMYPKVPDLRRLGKPDGAVFYSIRNGIRLSGMPAWSSQDSDEQIWGLVSLLGTMKNP